MVALEREYVLGSFCELRIITSLSSTQLSKVTLRKPVEDDDTSTAARAEVFGTELIPGVPVHLPPGRSLSIFTSTGCTLSLVAPPTVLQRCYATSLGATWVRSLLDFHSHLERARVEARGRDDVGPRVLFVSDRHHCGASTYVRWLSNFAVRLGYHPLLLDGVLDTPAFAFPGSIALFHAQHCMDIEEEMNLTPALYAQVGQSRVANPRLYLHWVQQLLPNGMEKMARSERCRVGGLFFDFGVVEPHAVEQAEAAAAAVPSVDPTASASPAPAALGSGKTQTNPLDTLLDTIVAADIDHVCVVGSSWLRWKLVQRAWERFGGEGSMNIVQAMLDPRWNVPPEVDCGGGQHFKVFLLDSVELVNSVPVPLLNRQRWLQYFFGTPTSPVKPTLITLEASQVRVATVGAAAIAAMSTLLPMMDSEDADRQKADVAAVSFITLQDVALKDRIVAISTATEYERSPDGELHRLPFSVFERRIRHGTVLGFALVESVTPERLTLLVSGCPLDKELGLCFLLTEEVLKS
ncbi:conserved hypothetical protein [Leishmania infantum JPCM5]|uniref:Uncharacterized protein n=2 Tax=Leishmania infantum TaxID=5671 RepID=A4I6B3_LEIIN|nr:conserved hypothetical protein [Leishmania infantum JPCM5]CAC9517368.1 hypothetical_protein_-_conserved [Leishmania infantum]CAM70337.1 conserved hypothetical protein [Leishmania infantum JPCM5]SUZ44223.1 hypothetical_protein_-_conserved [Leishmania infantum]|eukprot:XP_001467282.1 conserved hypothetical protein [Leishmania infantum JPCM5]